MTDQRIPYGVRKLRTNIHVLRLGYRLIDRQNFSRAKRAGSTAGTTRTQETFLCAPHASYHHAAMGTGVTHPRQPEPLPPLIHSDNERTFAGQGDARLVIATMLLLPPGRKVEQSNTLSMLLHKVSRPSRFVPTIFLPSFFNPSPVCLRNDTPNYSPDRSCHIPPGQRSVLDSHKFYMRPSRSSPDHLAV